MSAGTSSVLPNNTYANPIQELWEPAGGGGGGGSAGVLQIVAGTNVTITPASGEGVVTINASGGSAGGVTEILTGPGISASAPSGVVTLENTGVTSLVAGDNVVLSGATGAVTVSVPNSTPTSFQYIGFSGALGLPIGVLGYTRIGRMVTVTGRIVGTGRVDVALLPGTIAQLPPYSGPQFLYDNTFTVSCVDLGSPALISGRAGSAFGNFEMNFGGSGVTGNFTWTYPTA